ncbi:MAG: type II toxin-antitoxin system RelE/ParE family toxin [Acidimicrobiales bacterium]
MRLLLHPDARAAIESLRDDPPNAELLSRVLRALNLVRTTPGSGEARREAWRTDDWGQVWAIPVQGPEDDWVVVWTLDEPDAVVVLYVGPAV